MATGFVFHERYLWHDTRSAALWMPWDGGFAQPGEHAENAETKRRFRNLLDVTELMDHLVVVKPRMASEDEILRFHTRDYHDRIQRESAENGGNGGETTPFGPGSYEIALLAAGGTMAATDAVLDGEIQNAYALVRPPGHHAEADRGRGFCLFGNVALAAMHARATRGIGRVATVDWDVHHGNGTQKAFYDSSDVLTISIHQDNNYPAYSGGLDERGEGKGEGYNINIPLPPGAGHGAYMATLDRVVLPALERFKPELIFVPSGFDGSVYDPLGRQMAYSETYRLMTRLIMQAAQSLCGGRLVLSHEGGYSAAYVPFCGLAVMEELSGVATGVADPFLKPIEAMTGHALYPHQETVIAVAAEMAARVT